MRSPVTGATRYGHDSLLVSEDGGVFNFSDELVFDSNAFGTGCHHALGIAAFSP